jgi:hypothetical protein
MEVHDPAKFGHQLNRYIDRRVAEMQTIVTGKDLGKAGFAVRTIAPGYTSRGTAGFVEFGEELGQFIHAMKSQTGDDYGPLRNQIHGNRQYWAGSNALLHRRDKWNDVVKTVVLDTTSNSNAIFKYDRDLEEVPEEGTALERFQEGNTTYVRGIFPGAGCGGRERGRDLCGAGYSLVLYGDAAHGDDLYRRDRGGDSDRDGDVPVDAGAPDLPRRGEHHRARTRIVDGKYETEVVVSSDDEVGPFESLFEQLRRVFGGVLQHVPELEGVGTRRE